MTMPSPSASPLPPGGGPEGGDPDDGDGAVASRVRRWYHALQAFKKQPDALEFVYLKVRAGPADM